MKKAVSPVVAAVVIVIVIALIAIAIWKFSSRSPDEADQGTPPGFTKKTPPGSAPPGGGASTVPPGVPPQGGDAPGG